MARFGYLALVIVVTASAGMVSGCDKITSSIAGKSGAADVPASVQAMIDAPFAADGQVHVQSSGTFVIQEDTTVCVLDSRDGGDFGIQSNILFPPLGQSISGKDGSERQTTTRSIECQKLGSVIIYGNQTPNRQGKPYKLVLAVWQGDLSAAGVRAGKGAVWVGGIERPEGRWHPTPRIARPIEPPADYKPDYETLVSGSIASDISDLSNSFIIQIKAEKQ